MKSPIRILAAALLVATASAQTSLPQTRMNLDIAELSSEIITAGETLEFHLVSRIQSNVGNVSVGNLEYTIQVGSLGTIAFSDIRADGSIGSVSSTFGSVRVTMLDALDADDDVLGSSLASFGGRLNAVGDGLDRPVPSGEMWDSDWVFRVESDLPLSAALGTHEISGTESGQLFIGANPFAPVSETFPNVSNNRMPQSVTVIAAVPEPSTMALLVIGGLLGATRRRRA